MPRYFFVRPFSSDRQAKQRVVRSLCLDFADLFEPERSHLEAAGSSVMMASVVKVIPSAE